MWDIWVVLRHLPWLSHRLTFEFLDNPLKRKLKSHALGDLLIFLLMNLLIFQHKHGFTMYIYIYSIYIYILYHYSFITYYHHIWLSLSDITIHHQPLADLAAPGNLVGKDFTTVRRLYGCLGERALLPGSHNGHSRIPSCKYCSRWAEFLGV